MQVGRALIHGLKLKCNILEKANTIFLTPILNSKIAGIRYRFKRILIISPKINNLNTFCEQCYLFWSVLPSTFNKTLNHVMAKQPSTLTLVPESNNACATLLTGDHGWTKKETNPISRLMKEGRLRSVQRWQKRGSGRTSMGNLMSISAIDWTSGMFIICT